MKKSLVLSSLLAAAALVGTAAAEEHHLKPGLYEITTTMKMEGMPPGMMQPRTVQQCVTPDQAKSDKELVERSKGDRQKDCKIKDMNKAGNKITYKLDCGAKGTGAGEITYTADGYDGSMKMTMSMGPRGSHEVEMHHSAKRVGDCK